MYDELGTSDMDERLSITALSSVDRLYSVFKELLFYRYLCFLNKKNPTMAINKNEKMSMIT
uniref:Uncharacterized protein n=1 Tax=Salmonella enterica subsp. indica TaxID=59207 RepID=I3W3U7_SALER|nr:hypothetical protein [Salmonella enterica subsp. indica]